MNKEYFNLTQNNKKYIIMKNKSNLTEKSEHKNNIDKV